MADINPVVHVIDDDAAMRDAVCRLLGSFGFEVRQYESAGAFLLTWPVDAPGCLLLDVRMPGPSGMELQQALAQRADAPPVVFLTGYGDIAMSVLAIKRGAVDYLTKPVESESLLAAVSSALKRDVARRTLDARRSELRRNFATLTAREREVFEQVVKGRLNKQIAGSLGTCERTVKAHRARVMEKLHANSVAELVHIAVALEATASAPDAVASAPPQLATA
ncbi:MAG TPA: response regulator [Thermomonas sp.]|nr:response regulator [Thermomonas sp.]